MEDSHIINDLFNCAPVFTSSEASEQGRQPISVFPDEFRFFLIMDDLVEQFFLLTKYDCFFTYANV